MIVVDTHTWLWWASDPAQLGRGARRVLASGKRVGVPAICCLEVATLVARGRITLDRPALDWMQDALSLRGVEVIPQTPAIAVRASQLPADFPGDPADRLIVASALMEAAPLATKDERIRSSNAVRTIWT